MRSFGLNLNEGSSEQGAVEESELFGIHAPWIIIERIGVETTREG
jgi:hypothetical protein